MVRLCLVTVALSLLVSVYCSPDEQHLNVEKLSPELQRDTPILRNNRFRGLNTIFNCVLVKNSERNIEEARAYLPLDDCRDMFHSLGWRGAHSSRHRSRSGPKLDINCRNIRVCFNLLSQES